MIHLLVTLDILKRQRILEEGKKEKEKKGHNCDLHVKQRNLLFVHEITFPKGWKAVNIKLKTHKNKQKYITALEKWEGKTIFEQQVDKGRKLGLSSKLSLLFLFVHYFSKFSAMIVCWF